MRRLLARRKQPAGGHAEHCDQASDDDGEYDYSHGPVEAVERHALADRNGEADPDVPVADQVLAEFDRSIVRRVAYEGGSFSSLPTW
jgi:hypothetical protein